MTFFKTFSKTTTGAATGIAAPVEVGWLCRPPPRIPKAQVPGLPAVDIDRVGAERVGILPVGVAFEGARLGDVEHGARRQHELVALHSDVLGDRDSLSFVQDSESELFRAP